MASPRKMFVREASGLLRSLSGWEAGLIALSQLNLVMGLMELYAWGVVTVSQANYAIAILLSMPFVTIMALVWIFFGIILPRSGGEYVWVSRTLHPALGFMVGMFMVFLALAWTGLNAWLLGSVFLPGFLYSIGLQKYADIVAQPVNAFIIALIAIVIFTVAFIPKLKVQIKILWGLFLATLIGWISIVVTELFPSQSLSSALITLYGVSAETIIQEATKLGYIPGWTLIGCVMALPWAMQMWGGWWWAPYVGSEIQNPKRSMWIAVLGATYLSIFFYFVATFLAPNAFGFDLPLALNYLYETNSSSYPSNLPPPYFNYLAVIITNNYILKFLVGFGFFASILFIMPSGYFVASRMFFAWAFDRVLPEKVAYVSERFHTPVISTIITGVLLAILAFLTAFTSFWGYLVNIMIGLYFVFMIVGIAAIVMPYRLKEIYDTSPLANWKFLGIPALTLAGIGEFAVAAFLEYTCISSPALGGAISWTSIGSVIAILIAGPIIYYIAKIIRAKQGIPLDLVYKNIPPS
jgi:amino acid transporter